MEMFNNRRTIRKYTSKEVSEDLVRTLLEKAERTPTMGNLQLYSIVITREAEKKAQLAPAHFNQPMVMGAPVVLTFCADFRRTTLWAENRKAMPGYDNFLSFLNAATDALLYCQTFYNLAEEEGLGTCFLGTTIYNPQSIIKTLGLPRLVMPIATITLGWPDENPPSPTACLSIVSSITRLTTIILQPALIRSTLLRNNSRRINTLWKSTIKRRSHRCSPT